MNLTFGSKYKNILDFKFLSITGTNIYYKKILIINNALLEALDTFMSLFKCLIFYLKLIAKKVLFIKNLWHQN